MPNVTYLLGAGASFDTIPLVKSVLFDGVRIPSISLDMINLVDEFKEIQKHDSEKSGVCSRLITTLRRVGERSAQFSSPDTYARSIYLQGGNSNELEEVKMALSFYLTVKQRLHSIHSRYIPFFASILSNHNGISLPNNVKILTWNYDFQLELALQLYRPDLKDLQKIQEHFKIIPSSNKIESPSVIHLNGVAGMFQRNEQVYFNPYSKSESETRAEYLQNKALDDYGTWCSRGHKIGDSISFAWEMESHDRIEKAKKIMSETDIYIVIGYSFPFFNRNIDKALFQSLIGDKGRHDK